ncbi:MAG: hypothetical protein ACR2KV_13895 [Solirubrobacteraceae bacterium]
MVAAANLVSPNLGVILWTVMVGLALIAGCVTAANGRWGRLVVGLLTGGLLWLVTAFFPALPGSAWSRFARGKPESQRLGR